MLTVILQHGVMRVALKYPKPIHRYNVIKLQPFVKNRSDPKSRCLRRYPFKFPACPPWDPKLSYGNVASHFSFQSEVCILVVQAPRRRLNGPARETTMSPPVSAGNEAEISMAKPSLPREYPGSSCTRAHTPRTTYLQVLIHMYPISMHITSE